MKKNKEHRKRSRRRILIYTLSTLGALVLAGGGFGLFEYNQLQPKNHFNNLKSIAALNTTDAKKSAGVSNNTAQPSVKRASGTFNALIMGTDARHGQKLGHSDSMLLVHVDLNTHQYNILSLPRDMRVPFKPYGYTKLTSVQYMNQDHYGTKTGVVKTVQYISNLTGVPINYYAETDYWGLQDIVNAIGGIHMYLPFTVKIKQAWYPQDYGKTFAKGEHFFNGRLVTEMARQRYTVPGGDYGRQRLQEEAMIGVAKAMLNPKNATKIPKALKSIPKYLISTNIKPADMMSLLLGVRGNFKGTQIHYHQVEGKGELIYNGVLQAKDDEIVVKSSTLKSDIKKYL